MSSQNSTSNQNSIAASDESANQQFKDPGVSNGDVDWLFRGREVKKLSKRSNTINSEVQSQLLQVQQKALIQSKEQSVTSPINTTSSLSFNDQSQTSPSGVPLNTDLKVNTSAMANAIAQNSSLSQRSSPVAIPTRQTDTPLKSSLKSSSATSATSIGGPQSHTGLKVDTSTTVVGSPFSINSPLNDLNTLSSGQKSATEFPSSSPLNGAQTGYNRSSSNAGTTPSTPTSATRSRSSSVLFGRPKSSSVSEPKPQKKSFISSLSSKLKSSSSAASSSSSPASAVAAASSSAQAKTTSSTTTTSASIHAPVASSSMAKVASIAGIRGSGSVGGAPLRSNSPGLETSKPVSTHLSKSQSEDSEVERKLQNVSFKRVCFALDQLIEDPQQQIPSRRPKRGNVLIPEDMMAPPPKLSIGITNSHNEQTKDMKPTVDPKVYEEAVMRHKYFQQESLKHSQEAHVAAIRMAKEVSSFKKRKGSFLRGDDDDDDDDDDEDDENVTDSRFLNNDDHLDIDTPIHEHVNYFGNADSDANVVSENIDAPHDVSLETLYTRCCHLREILPIPATLKQLKDKSKPLHVLKMLNPKPTLIDVLSFSDFLAITPIITVIFDNVTIDTEMFKIILISLKNSTMLDKLSLRNVPIDSEGWKYLCKFLKSNKSIQKLDISQQRLKKTADSSKNVVRSQLDWDLFTDTLAARGGIEELVIHGCPLSTPQFNNLVNKALTLKTKRLGLASSQLDSEKMSILSKWISSPNSTCTGIDFAFNDLSQGQVNTLNNVLAEKGPDIHLQYFSLNSTNVNVDKCADLIKNLASLPSLKFLDLSNNPQLFPGIISTLRDYLPKYPDLRRLHFDFDDLEDVSIIQLCLIFQQCPKLVHVSFLGNSKITSRSAVALYSAIKNSHIYNMDMDYEGFDEELVSRMAFYLMRNMEAFLNTDESGVTSVVAQKGDADSERSAAIAKDEDLIFDGSLLTKAAEHLLESDSMIFGEERIIMYRSLVQKTIKLRTEIHNAMNKLFAVREKGTLSIEGKENLLRFCLLDDSLENILDIFSDEISKTNKDGSDTLSTDNKSSRPDMMRRLSSQLTRHMSSEDIMQTGPIISDDFYQHNEEQIPVVETEAPHIVVADADSVPVDSTTGKRVLMRNFSQTSVHSKKLEEEEGELHRWGFFVQQQNDIMPDDSQAAVSELQNTSAADEEIAKQEEKEKERIRIEAERAEQERAEKLKLEKEQEKKKLKINNIPSGSELRETIMRVKGIEKISDLIKKVNKDFSTVEKIYKHVDAKRAMNEDREENLGKELSRSSSQARKNITGTSSSSEPSQTASPGHIAENMNLGNVPATPNMEHITENSLSPSVSINSFNGGDLTDQADEVYDKLLNDIIRVRSNK